MHFKLFTYSVPCGESAEAELNGFLSSHRIVNVSHHVVPRPDGACLLFVVEYLDGGGGGGRKPSAAERIDYREKLSEADFEVFRRLREVRKTLAEAEGVPVYTVLTNAQLAEIAERRIATKAGLAEIEGVGAARVEKYGDRLAAACAEIMAADGTGKNDAADGQSL